MAIIYMFRNQMNKNAHNDGSFYDLMPKWEADSATYLIQKHVFWCIFYVSSFTALLP